MLQLEKERLHQIERKPCQQNTLSKIISGDCKNGSEEKTKLTVRWQFSHPIHLSIRNLLISRKNESYKIDLDVWSSFITDYSQVGYVSDKSFVVVMDSAQAATSSGNMYIFDMNTESWVYAYQKMNDEDKTNFLDILDNTSKGQGVQIFIGSQNFLFKHSGLSMVMAPYKNKEQEIIGAIGVVGPTRLNYAKIVPLVDYTSKIIGKVID